MKVTHIEHTHTNKVVKTIDCFVDDGYLQGNSGSLPDVDVDYQADRRQEVKEYIERRYNHDGKQRVFSAGTFTTLKLKAVLKDVARVHRVPVNIVNYITAIFDDDKMTWTDLFVLAATNRKVKSFIVDYPQVIEDIRTLMGQPRSSSVHASALLVTPDEKDGKDMECFDFTPIKKVDDMLVSELDGYSLDEQGLLKNDCLGIKELSKLQAVIQLCNDKYNAGLTFQGIVQSDLDDPKVYELLRNGYTQNVFQFSSKGMTKFLVSMKPDKIEDLIAANALFRPATLDSGSADKYVDCKLGDAQPVYLWGTYNAMKNTFGVLCIAEGSMVLTNHGEIAIEKIKKDDYVLTEDGTFQKVLDNYNKGIGKVLRVHTNFGEDIICTPEHKILTQFGWKCAKDLRPYKDLIKAFWTAPESNVQGTLQEWCLGLYLANGHYGTTCSIACRNQDEANYIATIFDNAFGLNCSVKFHTRCWYVFLRETDAQNSVHSKNVFKHYLERCGITNETCYSKTINIPITLELLAGFVEGDGCTDNNLIRLRNSDLAYQLYKGFQAHRIPSSYFESIEKKHIVYIVHFQDNYTRKLPYKFKSHKYFGSGFDVPSEYYNQIKLEGLDKNTKGNLRKTILHKPYGEERILRKHGVSDFHAEWGKVISVTNAGKSHVFDLSVENNHSFCVGGLIVHNCYQEQLSQIAHEVGGLSLGEGVKLVKFISKKKQAKIDAYKDKFLQGAENQGCPSEDAHAIWNMFEVAGSYLFNKSHATAYAVTAYAGAYLKANYPTAFYTVALQWAKDDEIPTLMSEMELCSEAKIVPPDINVSTSTFFTNFDTNEIFWSLCRIKQVGVKAVDWIVQERETRGRYTSIENFIERVFRYKLKKYQYWDDPDDPDEITKCPVNARHVRHLILSGCFDKVENAQSVLERYAILEKAAKCLGFEIKEKDIPSDLRDKHYFWSQQQIALSGIGSIDYKRIFDSCPSRPKIKGKAAWALLKNTQKDEYDGKRVAICASIADIEEKKYKSKETGENKVFGKLLLQQNNELVELIAWSEEWNKVRGIFANGGTLGNAKNKMLVCTAQVRYSEYAGHNNLQLYKSSIVEVI